MVSPNDGGFSIKEKMVFHNGVYMFNRDLTPTQNHQAFEELLDFQKDFAGDIYFQKDLDRDIR